MKSTIIGLGLVLVLSSGAFAQKVNSTAISTVNNSTSVSKNGSGTALESGTQIAAQLQSSIDVKKAKVGDQVVLKTTKTIKQNGQVVLNKGSNLIGRVTEVQQKSKENAISKVSVIFDTLQNGSITTPISATITSITQAQSSASINDDPIVSGSSSTNTQTQTSTNGGGLLGGVTNTVGNVVNTTTNTVGDVANTTGKTVGSATNTVGGTLKGIQISQSADVSAEGSSTLSLQGGNLRLEKGTTFNLRVTESSSINKNPNK